MQPVRRRRRSRYRMMHTLRIMSKTINRLWIVTETAAGWRVQNVTNGRPARTYDTAGKALGAIHRSIKRLRKRLSMSATLGN